MELQDLLRHIADNIENGRQPFIGLNHPFIADQHEKLFLYPEKFSLAPRTHVVNGFTVPAPEVETLRDDDDFFIEDPTCTEWHVIDVWDSSATDFRNLERGLIYLTKDAAVANAKARRNVDPYSEGEK